MTMDGLSGIGTAAGVYSFSYTGSAFLPARTNALVPINTPATFDFSCLVQISRTELLVMGGRASGTGYHGQVWKLDINKRLWNRMEKDLIIQRWSFGCGMFKQSGRSQYVLVAGKVKV